ncbi:MAG TPA: 6,7-dimethyl-8-ribityllumazine synthase [Acidimicrobiales bacterium]|nr:6,7-dimethyl-8-ribityllumazine synthase [Acidimicrobiales bacterium]
MTAGQDRAAAPDGLDATGLRIGVVRARWNGGVVARLAEGVERGLKQLGVAADDVVEVTVPGSFEIPFGARALATSGRVDAVICIGAVIRGETTHYELVAGECAAGVQQVQLATGVPVAFGVLTTEDDAQARARSEGPGGHNVGEEAAAVAVEMAGIARRYAPR